MSTEIEGVAGMVAWVKTMREKHGALFDTLIKGESEGGEVFLFDPEEVADLERELAAAFKAVESKAKHYAAWPETLFDGQSVADELRKLLALLTPTAREAAAATKPTDGGRHE